MNSHFRFLVPGLFSCLIREQAQAPGDGPKWMVMDGDIDPMWIESLNTVMDDNKVGIKNEKCNNSGVAEFSMLFRGTWWF